MNFPLYDTLCNNISSKSISVKNKKIIIGHLENIDETGKELVYALIKIHSIKNSKNTESLPYNAVYQNNDITWNIDELPGDLQNILLKFLNMHMEKINEEKNRGL